MSLRTLDQRRFLAQHSVAMLEQCCNYSKHCRNNVATLCCAKNRRCESSRVTSQYRSSNNTHVSHHSLGSFYPLRMLWRENTSEFSLQALVDIQWILLFPVDSTVVYPNSYPLTSDF